MAVKSDNYFYVYMLENERLGVAYAPEDVGHDLLVEGKRFESWRLVRFALRDGGFADYQANNLGWSLCSDKMHNILTMFTSYIDDIQWLLAEVSDEKDNIKTYHILHLPERPDVLNKERTIYAGDFVVKAALDPDAVRDHKVFAYSGATRTLIISQDVRDALLSNGCTGMEFSRVPMAE